jgi:hypothetical protein
MNAREINCKKQSCLYKQQNESMQHEGSEKSSTKVLCLRDRKRVGEGMHAGGHIARRSFTRYKRGSQKPKQTAKYGGHCDHEW